MKTKEILNAFKMLAKSQGFYGSILARINEMEDSDKKTFFTYLENKNFHDVVDLILFMEG